MIAMKKMAKRPPDLMTEARVRSCWARSRPGSPSRRLSAASRALTRLMRRNRMIAATRMKMSLGAPSRKNTIHLSRQASATSDMRSIWLERAEGTVM